MNLLNNTDISRVLTRNAGTAGQTAKGTIVDMAGFEAATFVIAFQDVVAGAVVTARVAQGDVNNTGDMVVSTAALPAITAAAADLDNKLLVIEVEKPLHRYLEIQVAVATQNAPIDAITCIRSRPAKAPRTQGDTVFDADTFVSPAAA